MEEAGLGEIGVYIQNRQNRVAQNIATRPILDLYEKYVCRTGAWISHGGSCRMRGLNQGRKRSGWRWRWTVRKRIVERRLRGRRIRAGYEGRGYKVAYITQ